MGLAALQYGPVLGLLMIPALSLLVHIEGAPTNPVAPNSNPVLRQPTTPVPLRHTTALPASGLEPSDARTPTAVTLVTLATLPPALESMDSAGTTSQELQKTTPPSSGNSLDPPAGFTTGVPVTTESMSCELTTETPEGFSEAPDVLSAETTTVYSREDDAQDDPIENRLGLQREDMVNLNQASNHLNLSWNHSQATNRKQMGKESFPVEKNTLIHVLIPESAAHLLNLKQTPAPTPEVIFVRYKATRQPPLFNTPVKGFVSTQAREFSTSRDFDFRDISKRDIVRSWSESGGSLDFASELRRSTQKRERCRAYNAAVEVNSILNMDSDGRSVGGSPVFEFVRRGVPHFGDLCNVLDEGPVTEAHPWYRPTHVQSSGEKDVIDHSGLTIKAREIVKLFSSRYRNS